MTQFDKEESNAPPSPGLAFIKRLFSTLPSFGAHLVFWPLMAAGLLLDLWSKNTVFDWLQQQRRDSFTILDGFLQLVVAENPGAAFGIAAGQTQLLVGVSSVALIVIIAVFFFSKTEHALVHAALGLFAAGVCGNLWDRIFNGGLVRDFIDVYYRSYHWPAFNVADSMLCIGVGLLIISGFFTGKSYRGHAQQHK